MFEITDEFLAQAGFGMLPPEAKEQMRQNVTSSVQTKITDQLLAAVGEQKLGRPFQISYNLIKIYRHFSDIPLTIK